MAITFRGVFQDQSGSAVEVPPEIIEALGSGKRPPVKVSVNGVELRTTIAVYGGHYYVGFRREIREAAKLKPGDSVELSIELDGQPRLVEVPDDFEAALAKDPEARRVFTNLSFTNRNEYVRWVLSARRPATRERRVAQAAGLLKSGRRTPLG
jgi:Bacteriocin-protection, YdeI or OmpD-Associated/Domain of unknown function (DUF1905)